MYIKPIFLWSTVTTQLCTCSSQVPYASLGGVRSMALPIGRVESAITENSCLSWPVSRLLQGIEVSDDLVDLVIAQLHRRHQASWLDIVRVFDPQLEIRRGIVGRSGSKGVAAHEVSKVWPELSLRGGAAHHVATDAGLRLEELPAFGNCWILHRGLLLIFHPGVIVFRGLHVDTQQHLGMFHAAELGTLAHVHAGFIGIEPDVVHLVRNQVDLAGQLRNPEA